MARNVDPAGNERAASEGISVITVPDTRWQRVDIKSTSLLPNVLAKQAAVNVAPGRPGWWIAMAM